MPEEQSAPIRRRTVFFIGGYDPKSPQAFFERMARETARFEELWGVDVENSEPQSVLEDVTRTSYKSRSRSDNWQVQTDFNFLSLDDIVLKDFAQPLWKRMVRYAVTFLDYMVSGTGFAFFAHAWRFALYFLYPAIMLLLALALSIVLAFGLAELFPPARPAVTTLIAIALFIVMIKLLGQRTSVLHLMDLWSFSRDFLHGNRTDIRDKLNRLADLIAETATHDAPDELILVGHSTGGALMLDAAARAADRHPEIKQSKARITILTVGSTALKIGLHPKAKAFRLKLENLFATSPVRWVEYQCRTDIINFYQTDPAKLMGLDTEPVVRSIKIKNMVSDEVYNRIKSNWFRVHYQFVFGNTKPYHYDFPGICFGPVILTDRARDPERFTLSLTGKTSEQDGH